MIAFVRDCRYVRLALLRGLAPVICQNIVFWEKLIFYIFSVSYFKIYWPFWIQLYDCFLLEIQMTKLKVCLCLSQTTLPIITFLVFKFYKSFFSATKPIFDQCLRLVTMKCIWLIRLFSKDMKLSFSPVPAQMSMFCIPPPQLPSWYATVAVVATFKA